ncbi:pyridoxal phosphate-dependent aminotransferase [Roseiterribacter gracilis]|uniref:aspartate transaminase n=1 Tax=Roseiterribacter gracilis TaxID=2812848 RepID=A0A8S8XG86_9PROT|nr:aminotransferase [Rhodospirillales bacterium TMPK1]
MKISARAGVAPFLAMDVLARANARAAAGDQVLHLEVGQPSTGAPSKVIAAAQAALASDKLGYTEALGTKMLRARIAQHYREQYSVELDPKRVVVTTGSSGGFVLGFLAMFDPGDRIAMAAPAYPAYRNLLMALGLEAVELQARAEDRWQMTPALLETLERPVQGLLLASPANPTGAVLTKSELAALADWARNNRVRLLSDEIYHGIEFGPRATSALEVDDGAIVFNGFSKYFCMTGWRLGWMVVPPDLERPVERLAQNLHIAAPTLAQQGAVVAFDCRDELDANVRRYAASRNVLTETLTRAGVTGLVPPDGAFYFYADLGFATNDSIDWCARLLDATGVAATPGMDFDPARGNHTIRLAFPGSTEEVTEAAKRIENFLQRN